MDVKDEIEEMTEKKVNYKVRYTGKNCNDLKTGKVYTCISEWFDKEGRLDTLSIIDETKDDYLYSPKSFEKI